MTEPGREPVAEPSPVAEPVEATQAFWRHLGLPGLFDAHVHFMPPRIQRAVWEAFAMAEHHPKLARPWPIRYQMGEEERLGLLRQFGVRRFSALSYAHRPGVATYLNDWGRDFAASVPEALWSATLYPEPEAAAYVGDLLAGGVEVFKVHAQVGEFRLDDPLLDDVWGLVAEAGTPVVTHIGSGPIGNEYTGPEPLRKVLARHPELSVIVAHMGAPEYADFLDLAAAYPRVWLDTTMVFTDFFGEIGAFPEALLPRLTDLGDRILLGTDFPSIPYPYHHQLEALARLDLGEEWLRAVCWDNGVRLFGEPSSADEPVGTPAPNR